MDHLPLPDFLVIAPAKSGTNTIFHLLAAHPQICLANHTKGTRFFTDFYGRGLAWYSRFFSHCPQEKLKGEVDETYFFSPKVPQRLARHIPACKLITCLRNPVDRAWSLYLEFKKFGFIQENFSQALDTHQKPLVEDNFYDLHIKRYLDHFSRKNILVLLFDELRQDLQLVADKIFTFLDLPCIPAAPPGKTKSNPARPPRFATLNRLAFQTIWLFRRLNLHSAIAWAKHSPVVQRLLFKEAYQAYPHMDPGCCQELVQLFAPHNQRLSQLLDLDLTCWQDTKSR